MASLASEAEIRNCRIEGSPLLFELGCLSLYSSPIYVLVLERITKEKYWRQAASSDECLLKLRFTISARYIGSSCPFGVLKEWSNFVNVWFA